MGIVAAKAPNACKHRQVHWNAWKPFFDKGMAYRVRDGVCMECRSRVAMKRVASTFQEEQARVYTPTHLRMNPAVYRPYTPKPKVPFKKRVANALGSMRAPKISFKETHEQD